MKFAYVDPPYVGQAKKHYGTQEVNHKELVDKLYDTFDGWALSCSAPSLQYILSLCGNNIRIGAWVKPFCIFKPNVNPAYAWEPVVFHNCRPRTRKQFTARDWISANITLKKGIHGVKPPEFDFWILRCLNVKPKDSFFDLFPGSGGMDLAHEIYVANEHLADDEEALVKMFNSMK